MVDGVLFKDGMAQIYTHCPNCMKQFVLTVPEQAYKAWARKEAHIQDAMPMLSADERELLLSGLCPKCWNKLFGEETI